MKGWGSVVDHVLNPTLHEQHSFITQPIAAFWVQYVIVNSVN